MCRFDSGAIAALEEFVQEHVEDSDATAPNPDVEHHGGIDRRHTNEMTYDEFVAKYMRPNRPVLIQVRRWSQWMRMCICRRHSSQKTAVNRPCFRACMRLAYV